MGELATEMLRNDSTIAYYRLKCLHCMHESQARRDLMTAVIHCDRTSYDSTADFIQSLSRWPSDRLCPSCRGSTENITHFKEAPPMISLAHPAGGRVLSISKQITVRCESVDARYDLRGIVYFSHEHFTSRIMKINGDVRYHDGITSGGDTILEAKLSDMQESDLSECRGGVAALSVYSKK